MVWGQIVPETMREHMWGRLVDVMEGLVGWLVGWSSLLKMLVVSGTSALGKK